MLLQPGDVEERCGLLLDDDTVVEVKNIAEDPVNSYKMDPLSVLPLLDRVRGTWHTHPDSDPNLSGDDYSGFLAWPDLEHLIIGRRNGQIVSLRYRVENGLVIACD
jgi:proteasome lid subunit RPN8/RPN11